MNGDHRKPAYELTAREREVLALMARGLTNGDIAERLDISFATAKNHVSAIIGKLGVETREEAVRAWRHHQRPGARFSRMVRGLAAGVGMWKVAAGAAGVAMIGVGLAAGVLALGSETNSPVHNLDAVTATAATNLSATPDWRRPGNLADAMNPVGEIHVLGSVDYLGSQVEFVVYESALGWCWGIRDRSMGCGGGGPPDEPQLRSTSSGEQLGGPGLWTGSTSLEADHVEIVLAGGEVHRVELLDPPPQLGFGVRYWFAVVDRSADLLEVRAIDENGAVLDTTGEFPDDRPHIVSYDQVNYYANIRSPSSGQDPVFQRLPTDTSTGIRFGVVNAPSVLRYSIEHEGTQEVGVRFRCDVGPSMNDVTFDSPRGDGGSGEFLLEVPDGATLCEWQAINFNGNFLIRYLP